MEFHTFVTTFYASYSALRIALEIFPGSNLKSANVFPQNLHNFEIKEPYLSQLFVSIHSNLSTVSPCDIGRAPFIAPILQCLQLTYTQ